ncbi:MAG: hypothetical protein RID42_09175 [Alphaproteobacteria bacterium]
MNGMGLGAGLGAIGFWGFVAAVVVAAIWYYRGKYESQQETMRRMLESNKPVDPVLTEKLLAANVGGNQFLDRDLMVAGIVVFSVAPGVAVLGWVLTVLAPEILYPLLGAAAVLVSIGIGLFVAGKIAKRYNDNLDG